MGRLSIDVTDQEHQQIKAMAALQGKTIREYAIDRLLRSPAISFPSEEVHAWEAFRELMEERIQEADSGQMSHRSIDDIFEETKREMREDN